MAALDTRFPTAGAPRPAGRAVTEHYPAPRVLLVQEAAQALIGTRVDEGALKALAAAASAACRPIDDKRGTKEFRIKVAGVLARRAAERALARAMGKKVRAH